MKILLSAAFLSIVILTSCAGSSSEKEYVSPTAAAAPVTGTDTLQKKNTDGIEQILGANTPKPAAVQVPVNVPTTAAQPVPATVAVNAAPAATPTTAAGLNPAHGQPGHRCELAVGAPLSSAPAAKPTAQPVAQPITVKQNAPTIIPSEVKAVPAAAGMNPQHGQPGHRCDIAVGAPLNSKPAAPAPQAVQATPAAKADKIQPVQALTQLPATITPTAPGMNPAHGQPGHRCDISVGAPLNSAPAKKDSSR
jgi:hypothetical protein